MNQPMNNRYNSYGANGQFFQPIAKNIIPETQKASNGYGLPQSVSTQNNPTTPKQEPQTTHN